MEKFLSGYCRSQDQSRMVEVEIEDGRLLDADCDYECCPFRGSCLVAAAITELLNS